MYATTLFRSRAVGKGRGDWFVTGGRPSRAVALRTWTPSCKPRVVGRIIRRVPRTARHQGCDAQMLWACSEHRQSLRLSACARRGGSLCSQDAHLLSKKERTSSTSQLGTSVTHTSAPNIQAHTSKAHANTYKRTHTRTHKHTSQLNWQ